MNYVLKEVGGLLCEILHYGMKGMQARVKSLMVWGSRESERVKNGGFKIR